MQDPLEQGETNSEQRSRSYTLVGWDFQRPVKRNRARLGVDLWVQHLHPLAQSKEPWLGQITCFAKFTGVLKQQISHCKPANFESYY